MNYVVLLNLVNLTISIDTRAEAPLVEELRAAGVRAAQSGSALSRAINSAAVTFCFIRRLEYI
jgi:hypothetical protein